MSYKASTFLLAVFVILHMTNAKVVHNKPRLGIIHGEETVPHSVPYVVHLVSIVPNLNTGRNLTSLCTGSRISDEYILTAKHCIDGAIATFVEMGKHHADSFDSGQRVVRSDYYIVDTAKDFDIALIKLPNPVNESRTIQNVVLPLKRDAHASYAGQVGIAYGWGQTESGSTSKVLLQATLPVLNSVRCDYAIEYYDAFPYLRYYEFCTSGLAGDINKGTCHGDSGGPFVIDGVQVGITVRGRPDCKNGAPSVYISVGEFLDWIEYETGIPLN